MYLVAHVNNDTQIQASVVDAHFECGGGDDKIHLPFAKFSRDQASFPACELCVNHGHFFLVSRQLPTKKAKQRHDFHFRAYEDRHALVVVEMSFDNMKDTETEVNEEVKIHKYVQLSEQPDLQVFGGFFHSA